MKVIRWTPTTTGPSLGLQDDIDQLFSGYFARAPREADVASVFTPAVDIEETLDEYVLRADLPGVSQADVKVSLLGDTLTLRGERRHADAKQDATWRHSERIHGAFERAFKLSRSVDANRVSASYRDGVLEVHVPKAEGSRMREIEVKVG